MTDVTRRRLLRAAGVGAGALTLPGSAGATPAETIGDDFEEREWGYVRKDWLESHDLDGEDELPSVLMMDGYKGASSGESPTSLRTGQPPTHYVRMDDDTLIAVSVLTEHPLKPEGTALVWASARGTGCSGGTFDLFDTRGAKDGHELIEWLADRPWSLDRVGLFGASYSAILALTIAAATPDDAPLAAMCVSAMIGDLYRGAVFPGGVPNPVFPALWTQAYRRAPDKAGTYHGVSEGDEICARNVATRGRQPPTERAVWLYTQREDDREWRARSPIYRADSISVPTYISQAWQDEQTGPRGGIEMFEAIDPDPASPPGWEGTDPKGGGRGREHAHEDPKLLRTTNGVHSTAHSVALRDAADFFRYWLLGEDTGIMDEPQVKHHLGATSASIDKTLGESGYVTQESYYDGGWERLYLDAGGSLSFDRPDTGTDRYVSGSPRDAWVYGEDQVNSTAEPVTQANGPDVLFYEAPAFEEEHVIAGPTTATLFVDSTAPEFDLFVRLSDVAPDGTTIPLQRGLLRASHRDLSEERTVYNDAGDVVRPYHPHTNPDQPVPGRTYRYDVEVFGAAHVFRPGHRLQVSVTTPPLTDGLWGYEPSRAPGINTVHRGGDQQASRVVVPLEPWREVDGDKQLPTGDLCEYAGYRCISDEGGSDGPELPSSPDDLPADPTRLL
jgi:putative CocE/NonD family hydrolase